MGISNMSVLRRVVNVVPRAVQRRTQIVLAQEQAALAPVSAETSALLKQAEQPWSELSVETKKALYRAIYKTTRAENIAAVPNDTAFVGAGTLIGVLCGFGLFKGIGALMINDANPSTTQGEGFDLKVKDDIAAKQAERGLNPMSGYGSAEWKAEYNKSK